MAIEKQSSRPSRTVVASATFLGASVLLLTPALIRLIEENSGQRLGSWLVAAPGILLIALAILAMGNLRRMSELEQRLHTEAMAFAFRCSVLLVAGMTYMAAAELPTPQLHWVLIAMVGSWAIRLVLASWRER